MTFADAVKAARKRRGLTQKELGAMIGTSDKYLSNIESGKVPGGWRLRKDVADALQDPELEAIVRPKQ